ncbi:hypothetical protein PHJA_000368800 [Phtheirospermum japonicum]|uniref:Myeloid leukemia factor 1 n=1 Tax=Phtheirospermum japonicum TaxID=374723 RepID=A0A830B5P1_9LAMI|nr:hypothetical protein PHJA_000368800 [Phtheirospermum japonicum]
MQGDREKSGSPFDSGFGFGGSMLPSVFGGKDPFDDPFFSRPFGSLFGSSTNFSSDRTVDMQHTRSKGPVIQELDSDDEGELVEKQKEDDDVSDTPCRNRNPLVEHPEDQANDHGKSSNNGREISYSTNHDKVEANQQQPRGVSYQRVTYGGINGAYYTATTSRRTGNDGAMVEESRQADRTTGQATHRVSRGLHDKGHSVTRKLDSAGKVDTVQTLHNLNEDELVGFEQAWRSKGDRLSHGWNDAFDFPGNSGAGSRRQGRLASWGGIGLQDPFREHSDRNGLHNVDRNLQAQCSRGRPKKVVTINIE